MSDNFPASIEIGGELTLTSPNPTIQEDWNVAIQEFVEYFQSAHKNFEEESYKATNIEELAREVNDDGYLTVADSFALNGYFDDLETLCKFLRLSYNRVSDACYEYNGEYTSYRHNEKPQEESFVADQSGRIMIPLSDIQGVLDILNRKWDHLKVGETLKELRTTLELITPRHKTLPKFKLVK